MNITIICEDDDMADMRDMTAYVTKEGVEKIIEILIDKEYILGVKIKYPDMYDSSNRARFLTGTISSNDEYTTGGIDENE